MRTSTFRLALGIACAMLAAVVLDPAGAEAAGKRRVRTRHVRSILTPAAEARARGTLDVQCWFGKDGATQRECVRVQLRRLERGVTYEIWSDDPTDGTVALVRCPPYTITPTNRGQCVIGWDTRTGGTMPFGVTAAELAGLPVVVRGPDGDPVLAGTFPAVPALR